MAHEFHGPWIWWKPRGPHGLEVQAFTTRAGLLPCNGSFTTWANNGSGRGDAQIGLWKNEPRHCSPRLLLHRICIFKQLKIIGPCGPARDPYTILVVSTFCLIFWWFLVFLAFEPAFLRKNLISLLKFNRGWHISRLFRIFAPCVKIVSVNVHGGLAAGGREAPWSFTKTIFTHGTNIRNNREMCDPLSFWATKLNYAKERRLKCKKYKKSWKIKQRSKSTISLRPLRMFDENRANGVGDNKNGRGRVWMHPWRVLHCICILKQLRNHRSGPAGEARPTLYFVRLDFLCDLFLISCISCIWFWFLQKMFNFVVKTNRGTSHYPTISIMCRVRENILSKCSWGPRGHRPRGPHEHLLRQFSRTRPIIKIVGKCEIPLLVVAMKLNTFEENPTQLQTKTRTQQ